MAGKKRSKKRASTKEPSRSDARSAYGVTPMVCIPLERSISHASEVFPWIIAVAQQSWGFGYLPYCRTDVARNRFARHFLNTPGFTHLVMLDLDHIHPKDVVFRLCKRASEGKSVVSALYFRRGEPFDPIAYVMEGDKATAVIDWEPGEIRPVDLIGCGALIIARDVFEKLPEPWFAYEYPAPDEYPTEDIYFSKACKEAGIDVWVDFGLTTDHLTMTKISEKTFAAYLERVRKENRNGSQSA